MDAHDYNLRSRRHDSSNSTTALNASRHLSHPPPLSSTGAQITANPVEVTTGGGVVDATGDRIPANPGDGMFLVPDLFTGLGENGLAGDDPELSRIGAQSSFVNSDLVGSPFVQPTPAPSVDPNATTVPLTPGLPTSRSPIGGPPDFGSRDVRQAELRLYSERGELPRTNSVLGLGDIHSHVNAPIVVPPQAVEALVSSSLFYQMADARLRLLPQQSELSHILHSFLIGNVLERQSLGNIHRDTLTTLADNHASFMSTYRELVDTTLGTVLSSLESQKSLIGRNVELLDALQSEQSGRQSREDSQVPDVPVNVPVLARLDALESTVRFGQSADRTDIEVLIVRLNNVQEIMHAEFQLQSTATSSIIANVGRLQNRVDSLSHDIHPLSRTVLSTT